MAALAVLIGHAAPRGLTETGTFSSFGKLRATFASVDKVGGRFVFNIGGNKYRLVAGVDFAHSRVYVKAVLTHSEYDKSCRSRQP